MWGTSRAAGWLGESTWLMADCTAWESPGLGLRVGIQKMPQSSVWLAENLSRIVQVPLGPWNHLVCVSYWWLLAWCSKGRGWARRTGGPGERSLNARACIQQTLRWGGPRILQSKDFSGDICWVTLNEIKLLCISMTLYNKQQKRHVLGWECSERQERELLLRNDKIWFYFCIKKPVLYLKARAYPLLCLKHFRFPEYFGRWFFFISWLATLRSGYDINIFFGPFDISDLTPELFVFASTLRKK